MHKFNLGSVFLSYFFKKNYLADITVTAPAADQTLTYNGSIWVNETTRKRIEVVNTTITEITNGTWTVIPLNVERIKDAAFTHTTDSEDITFNDTDEYVVLYTCLFTTGGNNKNFQVRLEKDTGSGFVGIQYSNIYGISSGNESTSVGTSLFGTFTSGDVIRLTGQSISNSTSFFSRVGATQITIMRI